jgi:hypothetical protein
MTKQSNKATPRRRALRSADHSSAFSWRDERNQVPQLTIERARELVGIILQSDDDEEARALIELITGIGYEKDHIHRDGLASVAAYEAYGKTWEFFNAAERYATKAALRTSEGSSNDV